MHGAASLRATPAPAGAFDAAPIAALPVIARATSSLQ